MPTPLIAALFNVASPLFVMGILQFLSSIAWLLAWQQAGEMPLKIARWTLIFLWVYIAFYLSVGYVDLLGDLPHLITQWKLAEFLHDVEPFFCAMVSIVIASVVHRGLKHHPRKTETDYAINYVKSSFFILAGCAVIYGFIEVLPLTFLESEPDWFYYLGPVPLAVVLCWNIYFGRLSWPPHPPAASELTSDHQV